MKNFAKTACNEFADDYQSEKPEFLLDWYEHHTPARQRVELFIHDVFARAYGADVRQYLPRLMALQSNEHQLLAALGIREASSGPLFLERYLDGSVEDAISGYHGSAVARNSIVEIGNLASVHRGGLSKLMIALTSYLSGAGVEWVAFTAVPAVTKAFAALDLHLEPLAVANKSRLSTAEQQAWGSYYDSGPTVVVGRVEEGYQRLSNALKAEQAMRLNCYLWEYAFIAGCRQRYLAATPAMNAQGGM
ncbi:MAG: thermostable hemolysin [Gammaproteobacteria bacterium]